MAREFSPEELGITPAREFTPQELGISSSAQQKPEDVGIVAGTGEAFKRGLESFGDIYSGYSLAKSKIFGEDQAAAQKMQQAKADAAKIQEKPTLTFADLERIYEDKGLVSALSQTPKYITEQLAQSAPQMAVPLAVGAGAGALSGPFAPVVAPVAGVLTYGAQQLGNLITRQAQEKATPQELDLGKAATAAAIQAPIGYFVDRFTVGMGGLGQKGVIEVGKELAARKAAGEIGAAGVAKGVTGQATKGAAQGFIAEAPTEVLEQTLERWQAGLSLTDKDAINEYKEAFAGAGAAGGALGAGSRGYTAYSTAQQPVEAPKIEEVKAEPKAPAQLMLPSPEEIILNQREYDPLKNPLGNFTENELTPEQIKYIDADRKDNGKPRLSSYSLEDLVDAVQHSSEIPEAKQGIIDNLLTVKSGYTGEEPLAPQDLFNKAGEKNIETQTVGFNDFLRRTTGTDNIEAMSQPQLYSAFNALSRLPVSPELQILPEGTNAVRFSEKQYEKAMQGLEGVFDEFGTNALSRTSVIQEIQDFAGLEKPADAEALYKQALRNNDLEENLREVKTTEGLKTVPEVSLAGKTTALPSGFDIKEQEFKQGVMPESYEIRNGSVFIDTAKTEADANQILEKQTKINQDLVKQPLQELAQLEKAIEERNRAVDVQKAKGFADTLGFQKMAAHVDALNKIDRQSMVVHQNDIKNFTNPLKIVPFGEKPITAKKQVFYEDGKPLASFGDKYQAEQYGIMKLDDAILQQIIDTAPTTKGILPKRYAAFAAKEIERRAGKAPKGIEVKRSIYADKVNKDFEKLQKSLLPALERFGLKDVALRIVNSIADGKADGSYVKELIKIAYNAENPMGTLRHEAIHALKELGAFTAQEWKVLSNKAKSDWIDTYIKKPNLYKSYQDAYKAENGNLDGFDAYIIEEAIAEAFSDFANTKPPAGLIGNIFYRLNKMFESLGNTFKRLGYTTAADVFSKVEAGETKPSRKAVSEGEKFAKKLTTKEEIIADGIKRYGEAVDKHLANYWDGEGSASGRGYVALERIEDGIRKRLKEVGVSDEKNIKDQFGNPISEMYDIWYNQISPKSRAYAKNLKERRRESYNKEQDEKYSLKKYTPEGFPESEVRPSDRGTEVSGRGDRRGREEVRVIEALAGAPIVEGATGPDPRLVSVAERYAKANGIPYERQKSYVALDEDRAKRIAQAYEDMADAPNDPKVKAAYKDMMNQVRNQYDALVDDGYEFTFFDSATDPYDGNPWNAMRDLRKNKRMAVYGTYDGFGTEGITTIDSKENPLLANTGLKWKDQNGVEHVVTANDLFRAVHDAFGHGLEGAGFRAQGEENAWQAHAKLFTGPALGALTTETRGQNSWLNYGKYGEKNKTANIEDTVFAPQKIGLMPDWTWEEGVEAPKGIVLGKKKQPDAQTYEGIHYSTAERKTLDGRSFGSGLKGAESKRLAQSNDPRIKNRVYFYIPHELTGKNIPPEAGVGMYAHKQTFENILPPGKEMKRLNAEAGGNANEFESLVIDAGYDGYAVPSMGMMVILNQNNIPVKPRGTQAEMRVKGEKFQIKPPETKEFKQWFGDSKVVDSNGNPLLVYHATTNFDGNEFKPSKKVNRSGNPDGYYFTHDIEDANNYAGEKEGSEIIPAFLSIKKPYSYGQNTSHSQVMVDQFEKEVRNEFDLDRLGEGWYKEKLNVFKQGRFPNISLPTDAMTRIIQAGGYDGMKDGRDWVAFKPNQIKSAFNQEPTDSKDIRYQIRAPETKEFKQWFGNSKIVDDAGNPLVVYHGTKKDFTEFKTSYKDGLFFFSTNPKFASNWPVGTGGLREGPVGTESEYKNIKSLEEKLRDKYMRDDYDFKTDTGSAEFDSDRAKVKAALKKETGYSSAVEFEMNAGIQVMPVYLSIQKPFDPRIDYKKVEQFLIKSGNEELVQKNYHKSGNWVVYENSPMIQELKRLGYDGIWIAENVDGPHETIAAFNQNQIKSAFNQKPTESADIRYQIRAPETKEFEDWFEGSKVVNEDGSPKLVFTGTSKDTIFNAFRISKNGVWFSEDPKSASTYAVENDSMGYKDEGYSRGWERKLTPTNTASRVIPAFLRIKNPFKMTQEIFDEYLQTGEGQSYKRAQGNYFERLRAQGYDGVDMGDGVWVVILSPDQIKSAFNEKPISSKNKFQIRPQEEFDVPETGRKDNLIFLLQDKQIDLKRIIDGLKAQGKEIADKWNAYLQEELFHGRSATRVKFFIDRELQPLLRQMDESNITLSEMDDYLLARHAKEANEYIRSVNKDPSANAGMTDAEAEAYIKAIPPMRRQVFDRLATEVDKMTKETRQLMVDYGLESQETINAWEKTYKTYVPLFREETEGSPISAGRGFNIRGSTTRTRTGSSKKVVDVLANVALQRERTIARGEKNRVGNSLLGLILQNPNSDYWIAVNPDDVSQADLRSELIAMGLNPDVAENLSNKPKERKLNPETGLYEYKTNPMWMQQPNVFMTRVNGQDRIMVFNENNERAARMAVIFNNLDQNQKGQAIAMMGTAGQYFQDAINVIGKGTRYFAAINTQYNPAFSIYNFMRDVGGATLNLQSTALKGKEYEVISNAFIALKSVYQDLRLERAGKNANSKWAEIFEEFELEGGKTGFRDLFNDSETRARALETELNSFTQGAARQKAKAVFDWLSDFNEAVENSIRVSAYKSAKDMGMSPAQAASLAKNLTVNFNRTGAMSKSFTTIYAFFNASIQGSARIAQTLMNSDGTLSSAGKMIIKGGITVGVMQAILMAIAGFEDDEPPDFVKDKNFVIPYGDKKYIAIPMPLGFNIIPSFGRRVAEFVMSNDKNVGKTVFDMGNMILDGFNPLGSATFAQTLSPTLTDPIIALAENKDFSGKPISRDDINSLNPTPGYTRAKDNASALSTGLAYAVNLLSGGTEFKKGVISPTPDQLDYLIGQITGGVGREVLKVEKAVGATISGEDLATFNIPIVGRMIGDVKQKTVETSRFYDNIKSMNEHQQEIDGRLKDGEDIEAYLDKYPEAGLYKYADKVYNKITKLKQERKKLKESGATDNDLKGYDEAILAVMMGFNEAVIESK